MKNFLISLLLLSSSLLLAQEEHFVLHTSFWRYFWHYCRSEKQQKSAVGVACCRLGSNRPKLQSATNADKYF